MRTFRTLLSAIVIASTPILFAPSPASADLIVNFSVGAPPDIPAYTQPYVPGENYIWQPGYWAWSEDGYFWVPGTWVQPPQDGYLWTPGYWGQSDTGYSWNPGYWAPRVGYYGGVNYGNGYYGDGYDGGRWNGSNFQYNTYVTNVNTQVVRNCYVDRTVYIDRSDHHWGYNGRGGWNVQPTSSQYAIEHDRRFPMTRVQNEHERYAAADRNEFASYNHGTPQLAASTRPFSASNDPIRVARFESTHPAAPLTPAMRYQASASNATITRPAQRAQFTRPLQHAQFAQPNAARVTPFTSNQANRPARTDRVLQTRANSNAYAPSHAFRSPATYPVTPYHAPVSRPAQTHVTPQYNAVPNYHTAPSYRAQQAPAYRPVQQAPAYRPVQQAPAYRPVQQAPAYRPVQQAPAYRPVQQAPAHVAPGGPQRNGGGGEPVTDRARR